MRKTKKTPKSKKVVSDRNTSIENRKPDINVKFYPRSKTFKPHFLNVRPGKLNNLRINQTYDFNPNKLYPILLFTPDMRNTDEHYHVDLNKKQAKVLHQWLGKYLKRVKP